MTQDTLKRIEENVCLAEDLKQKRGVEAAKKIADIYIETTDLIAGIGSTEITPSTKVLTYMKIVDYFLRGGPHETKEARRIAERALTTAMQFKLPEAKTISEMLRFL